MKPFKIIRCITALILVLCLSGCGGGKEPSPQVTTQAQSPEPAQTTGAQTDPVGTDEKDTNPVTTVPVQTDPVTTAPPQTDPPQTQAPQPTPGEEALASIRRSMEGTTQIMGAACLGMVWELSPEEILSWIREEYPEFAGEMAFLSEMKPEQIVGGTTGEVYLLIPGDETGSLAVNGLTTGGEELVWNEVLYRSEDGQPILLVCNGGDYQPDAQVVYTSQGGKSLTWNPERTPYLFLSPSLDENYAHLILDLTPYREGMRKEYAVAMENGCTLPTADQLIKTRWECVYYINELDFFMYNMYIGEDGLDIVWIDAYDGEMHRLEDCRYSIEQVNGLCRFTVDLGEFAGTRIYHLLISEEYASLYTFVNMEAETIYRDAEPLMRMMYQQDE